MSAIKTAGTGLPALPRENPIDVGAALVGQALRLPKVISSATEAVALPTRSCSVDRVDLLLLFPKLYLLSEELGIAGVFRQKLCQRPID